MIEKGEDYLFAEMQQADRGWVFCPEYAGASPLEISPAGLGYAGVPVRPESAARLRLSARLYRWPFAG